MSTEAQTQRQRIAAKINALLKKTVENGCTESEALSAASLANRLMQEYDLTYADCKNVRAELEEESFGARFTELKVHECRLVCTAIATYTNTFYWREKKTYVFFGTKDDTEIAQGMLRLIMVAMDSEWARYVKQNRIKGKSLRHSFMFGMAVRLHERINELCAERKAAPGSNALVVVKDEVVKQKFQSYAAATGRQIAQRMVKHKVDTESYEAGERAANTVDLGNKKMPKSQIALAHLNKGS